MTTPFLSCDDVLLALDRFIRAELPSETVPLEAALGRCLAEPVRSPVDVPLFSKSAMDGFAFRSEHLKAGGRVRLPVTGVALAGHPFKGETDPRGALRIMTGAPVPDTFDTVIPFEHVIEAEGCIEFDASAVRPAANVRLQGEEFHAGDELIPAGAFLTPEAVGLAASAGRSELPCRRLRVVVFASGDELREPGRELADGKIYNANAYLLTSLLRSWGADVEYLGILPDEFETMRARLEEAALRCDLLLTSGGVGEGDKDLVGRVVGETGELHHVHVKQRPGKPLSYGRIGRAYFMALPGNPAACAVSAHLYVRRAVERLCGATPSPLVDAVVTTTTKLKGRIGRTDCIRGHLDETGFAASPRSASSTLAGLNDADVLALLPENCAGLEPGKAVRVKLLRR